MNILFNFKNLFILSLFLIIIGLSLKEDMCDAICIGEAYIKENHIGE